MLFLTWFVYAPVFGSFFFLFLFNFLYLYIIILNLLVSHVIWENKNVYKFGPLLIVCSHSLRDCNLAELCLLRTSWYCKLCLLHSMVWTIRNQTWRTSRIILCKLSIKHEIFQPFPKEASMFLDFVSDKILSLSYPLVYDYGGTINWENLKLLSTCEDVTLALLATHSGKGIPVDQGSVFWFNSFTVVFSFKHWQSAKYWIAFSDVVSYTLWVASVGYPYLMVKLKAFLNCHCSNSWDIMSTAEQVLWIMLGHNFWHNFVSQLATWQVVIGNGVSLYDLLIYSYQSQLVTWQVVTQNYVKSCVPSIIQVSF